MPKLKKKHLVPLRRALAATMGPKAFWADIAAIARVAIAQGRQYLLYEEWDEIRGLVDYYGMLRYYQGGRDKEPRRREGIEPGDFLFQEAAPALVFLLRRVKQARAQGLTPWQFHVAWEREIDGFHVYLERIQKADAKQRATTTRSRDEAARGRTTNRRRRTTPAADTEGGSLFDD